MKLTFGDIDDFRHAAEKQMIPVFRQTSISLTMSPI